MKETIRPSVFETNSSSVHSLSICSSEEYSKWKAGEIVYCPGKEEFKPVGEVDEVEIFDDSKWGFYDDCIIDVTDLYFKYDDFFDACEDDVAVEKCATINGVEVWAIGWHKYY